MTFQPWILRRSLQLPRLLILLQWSHDLSAMDTLSECGIRTSNISAFNGAMTFQPWIRRRDGNDLACGQRPSMEP